MTNENTEAATATPKGKVNVKPKYAARDITLKRSKVVVTVPEDWHVQDSQAAQRFAKGDASLVTLALIQRVCKFDGETWPIDQIEEDISGKDWLQLQGEFYGDEEDEKNG